MSKVCMSELHLYLSQTIGRRAWRTLHLPTGFLLPVGVFNRVMLVCVECLLSRWCSQVQCSAFNYPQLTCVSFFVRWNAASNKGCDGMVRMVKRTNLC